LGGELLKERASPVVSDALIDVFIANRKQLIRFLRGRTAGVNGVEAEDILQELWVRVSTADIADIEDPQSYLFRMAHNLVLNRARDVTRRHSREADWSYVHGRDQDGVEEALAERGVLARERLVMVDKILRGLGDRAARVFHRYRIDGVDQRRIADELNVSLSTVEKDLNVAYRALLAFKEKGR
jgi:RNA polymerase sigma factor (sigma-70 family)